MAGAPRLERSLVEATVASLTVMPHRPMDELHAVRAVLARCVPADDLVILKALGETCPRAREQGEACVRGARMPLFTSEKCLMTTVTGLRSASTSPGAMVLAKGRCCADRRFDGQRYQPSQGSWSAGRAADPASRGHRAHRYFAASAMQSSRCRWP
jgi:hypothetical protein